MTAPSAPIPLPGLRRPPAPVGHLATVTRLSPPGAVPELVPVATVQGTLALDLAGLPDAPLTPALRLVPDPADAEEREVRAWAARFAQAAVEVVGGDRPLAQLLRWTNARVYQELDRRVRILARTAPATTRRRTIRPQVRSVHVCQPRPGCAEVSVHVRHGHRSRALAARLERRRGRWTCVALQLG
jgi:DNA-binding transcriptional regulator YdaS (Cro superfamily)